ncbi:hypothetical protein GTR05_004602 [Salmonella enterica]|nr:hypothetical protein [Salmonella enterica]
MHTILKYTLGPDSEIIMPMGARILSVSVENDEIVLWALGDTGAPTESRYIIPVQEGREFPFRPEHTIFIGTAQRIIGNDIMTTHVFEVLFRAIEEQIAARWSLRP